MSNTDETDCHTISMASSHLKWKDVDNKVKHSTFRNRSQYIQYLVERDFARTNQLIENLVPISLLTMMVLVFIVVIIK